MQCSQVVQLARVGVRVLVVDVVCVMLVLIARVVVHAASTQFRSQFSVVGDVLLQMEVAVPDGCWLGSEIEQRSPVGFPHTNRQLAHEIFRETISCGTGRRSPTERIWG